MSTKGTNGLGICSTREQRIANSHSGLGAEENALSCIVDARQLASCVALMAAAAAWRKATSRPFRCVDRATASMFGKRVPL